MMDDDALIKMMREAYQEVTLSYSYESGIRAALAVARPIIEREAYKKAEQLALTSKGYPTDVSQKIRALGGDND